LEDGIGARIREGLVLRIRKLISLQNVGKTITAYHDELARNIKDGEVCWYGHCGGSDVDAVNLRAADES
jgi:hypothetical protein